MGLCHVVECLIGKCFQWLAVAFCLLILALSIGLAVKAFKLF